MSRLQAPDETTLNDAQQQVFDTIASGPRGGVRGPLGIWLWRPEMAERAQALGQYCRYDSSLDARLSELAILVTARYWSSEYEWQAHKKMALQAGLDPAIVEAVRTSTPPTFTRDDESVVFEAASQLWHERKIAEPLYKRAIDVLGRDALIDLVSVVGYYGFVSMTINVFEIDATEPHEL